MSFLRRKPKHHCSPPYCTDPAWLPVDLQSWTCECGEWWVFDSDYSGWSSGVWRHMKGRKAKRFYQKHYRVLQWHNAFIRRNQ